MRQIGEGGILAELYRMAKEEGLGLDLELHNISLLQETVEVCEQVPSESVSDDINRKFSCGSIGPVSISASDGRGRNSGLNDRIFYR